jgi:hypothetical protein
MEIKSEPAYIDVRIRQLEVGVYGDVREVILYDRDTLKRMSNDDIYIKLLGVDGTTVLEETTFKAAHIQWCTIRYRTMRQLAAGSPTTGSPTQSASSPVADSPEGS